VIKIFQTKKILTAMLTGTKTHSDIYGERELIKTINKREKIETE